MTDLSRDQVVDYLSNLPVIQIAELIKTLEDKWGVKAAPVAVARERGDATAGGAAGGRLARHRDLLLCGLDRLSDAAEYPLGRQRHHLSLRGAGVCRDWRAG